MLTVVYEICPAEGFEEYVGVLLGRSYVLHRNFSSPEKIANEVVTNVYVCLLRAELRGFSISAFAP